MSKKIKRIYGDRSLHVTKKLEFVISSQNSELRTLKRKVINIRHAWEAFGSAITIAPGSTAELLSLRLDRAIYATKPTSPHAVEPSHDQR